MDSKFGGIFDKLVSLEKGVSNINIKIEEIKRNDDTKDKENDNKKGKGRRKIVPMMMMVQITLTPELMTLMIV
jgi:hypothetical protein